VLNNVVSTNYMDWFPDTSANQHVTPDLANLTGSKPYLGNDHFHVSDGKGLFIFNIGHTKLHPPKQTFTLPNVLHVPHIQKSLFSVQKFFLNNNIYFEFHSFVFYIKDVNTKALILSGQSKDGLYVLSESSAMLISQVYWSLCISTSVDL